MRGWIADKSTYWPRIEVGDTMRAFSAGEVIESRNLDYTVGDKVMGIFGWQDYAAVKPPQVMRKVLEDDLPLSLSLGVLGLNGLTAYFGLLDVCRPKAGGNCRGLDGRRRGWLRRGADREDQGLSYDRFRRRGAESATVR